MRVRSFSANTADPPRAGWLTERDISCLTTFSELTEVLQPRAAIPAQRLHLKG